MPAPGPPPTVISVMQMKPGQLAMSLSTDSAPTVLRMSVAGEIDQASAPQLRAALAEAAAGRPALLELDLADVTFCSSAGLAELCAARDRLDGRLVVTGAGSYKKQRHHKN
jgi:anti-anti-sigma factor